MQCEVFGLPVCTVNREEGPAYGAALLAAVGAGAFPDLAAAAAATLHAGARRAIRRPGPTRRTTSRTARFRESFHAARIRAQIQGADPPRLAPDTCDESFDICSASQETGLVIVLVALADRADRARRIARRSGCRDTTVNNFWNSYTLIQTATDASFFAIMAIGATIVIISGGIDLSVGSIYALSGVTMALLLRALGR